MAERRPASGAGNLSGPRVLAIDQGTSSTKAVLFDASGAAIARASRALASAYPRDGWAEQDAEAVWDSVRDAIEGIVAEAGAGTIAGLAIANQRESLVVWDAETGRPAGPIILWQDRRGAALCARLVEAGHGPTVQAATGLAVNPLLTAAKLGWLLSHDEAARSLAEAGRLRAGTVDAWLLWRLTGGATFATDHGNASRTQLLDTAALAWSEELCALFGVPPACLPEPRPSDGPFGTTAAGATALPAGVPILAVMGDSHAALYGHGVREPGPVKATLGTGSSLMTLTPARRLSAHGLAGSVAWSTRAGGPAHALEGNITVSAQAATVMAGLLGLTGAAALSDLAQTVPDAGGAVLVPAFAGLGAPHWDERARGLLAGLALGTSRAHLARATFEAIAHQVADVFEAMGADVAQVGSSPLDLLRVDGGASSNPFLLGLLADAVGCPVLPTAIAEVGALGVASMAFEALGQPLPPAAAARAVAPGPDRDGRAAARAAWRLALQRARLA